jgi:hypothetical protein
MRESAHSHQSMETGVRSLSETRRYGGQTMIGIHVKVDPEAAVARIPDPLEPVREGEAMVYFGEAIIEDPTIIEEKGYLPPHLSTFRESSISLPCEIDGRRGAYVTDHFAEPDWGAKKLHAMGHDSTHAEIQVPEFPPELREFIAPEAGMTIETSTNVQGTTRMSAEMTLEEPESEHPWPFALTVIARRRLADDCGQNLVNQVIMESYDQVEADHVWRGKASLDLDEGMFGDLKPVDVLDGYVIDIGMTFQGIDILWEG